MKHYDTFVIGHLSIDEILDAQGNAESAMGGAVLYSAYAAAGSGNRVGFFTKTDLREKSIPYLFPVHYDDSFWGASSSGTTSIRTQFLDEHHERRITTALVHASKILPEDIPADISASVYHLAGLMYGDFEDEIIKSLSARGKVALDMQGYLCVADPQDGTMNYHDWEEIKEVMITHHDEVLVYDGEAFHACPLKPLSLDGRTDRGDTTFSVYITERQRQDIQTSLNYAIWLVSLKMGTPGPFKGSRVDVEAFAKNTIKV